MTNSTTDNTQAVVDACLLAGQIMIQSGAETYRAEDTMLRMASAAGRPDCQSYVTPTGIIFSAEGSKQTHFTRIFDRGTDLEKIALVNAMSRKMAAGELTVQEALEELRNLEKADLSFPVWLQIVAAALVSGSFLVMFKGDWQDFLPAVAAGTAGFSSQLLIHHFTRVKFFAEFFASLLSGLAAFFFVSAGIGKDLDLIIIASVMPLVPGVLITNAVRDLMAGHLVAGLSKGVEAFLTAFAIGTGVAVVFSLWV